MVRPLVLESAATPVTGVTVHVRFWFVASGGATAAVRLPVAPPTVRGMPLWFKDTMETGTVTFTVHSAYLVASASDAALLAHTLGRSKYAVWKFLPGQRIGLAHRRTWCVSMDPEFAAKTADAVGPCPGGDEKAVVVCVDAKPNVT